MTMSDLARHNLARFIAEDKAKTGRSKTAIAIAAWPLAKDDQAPTAAGNRARKLTRLLDENEPHAADLDELEALGRALGRAVADFLQPIPVVRNRGPKS